MSETRQRIDAPHSTPEPHLKNLPEARDTSKIVWISASQEVLTKLKHLVSKGSIGVAGGGEYFIRENLLSALDMAGIPYNRLD